VGELISEQWSLVILITLAVAFNMYRMRSERTGSPTGRFFHRYGVHCEVVNWLVVLGGVVYLSWLCTWWFMLSYFLFPVLGSVVARIFGPLTQLLYMLGVPVVLIVVIIHLVA